MDRRQLLYGLAAGLATPTAARAADPAPPADLVAGVLRETRAPALAGLVVSKDRRLFLDAKGLRRIGGPDPVTPDDRWHLGSNTKAMTAAVYGRLVEKGRARWGATLPELFPDLTLDPAWRQTTIEAILGHRAGLFDEGLTGPEWGAMLATPKPVRTERTELIAKALSTAPKGPAGAFHYANADYILAGAAIERIADKPWEDVIRAELWEPLGITSAGFGAPKGAQPWGHAPAFFGSTSGPRPISPESPESDNPPALGPAGTGHMTLADYGKWLQLFLNDGAGVLRPETVTRLITPVPGSGEAQYALGWGVLAGARGRGLAHAGSNTLWYLNALVLPDRGLAFAVASNDASADGGAKACQLLGKKLTDLFAPV
ncbi:MAG: beta-lactamase family protein [Caulobacteraceae bacterium]|nr:beta-lactamase family protein [Caulobacteraceae bacterium]